MQKKAKQSITLPQLPNIKSLHLQITHDKEPHRPKLHRIFDQPITLSTRMLTNATILESILNKRTYEDTRQELKQQQISYFLRQTKSILEREDKNKGRVGREAHLIYYDNYKKLDKLLCKKKANRSSILQSLDNDPTLPVLEVAEDLRVLPCCMGFIKNTGDPNVLNLKGQKFGDKYIKAISAGIKQAKIIDNCQFSNNRITDEGLKQIANNLSNQIIKIDVSINKISKIPSRLLSLIIEPEARLQFLNLQNNLISDKAADLLFRSIVASKHLRYLNLRKNMLTKNCSQALSQLILRSISLEELYIGMNRINEEAAVAIIESLDDNRTIRVFDYCMNKLGESQTITTTPANAYKIAKMISKLVSTNKILTHVDLSSNNFNQQETKLIAQGLNKNKKIYGFHFHGNNGFIDSKGFLHPEEKNITTLHSIMGKNINSYDIVFRRQAMHMQPTKFRNVCWICEGWHEQLFKFKVPSPRQDGKNHVYIHFDFQEFEPRLINISEVKVKYKTMVPPRRYRYFFTWDNKQYIDPFLIKSENAINQKSSIHSEITNLKLQIPLNYTYSFGNESSSFKVEQVSCRSSKPKKIVNSYDQIIVSVLPRQEGLVSKKEKKAWSYKDSVWAKQWKLEDQQLTKNCFEKDWKCSKLSNFIKNQGQQDKVKQILYKNYKLIKQLYRQYSSWSPFNSDIWAVSNNAFTQFCYLAKIISKDTPLTIIDLTFITTNSISGTDYKGNSLVPERGLVRFQFMEGLVRLSQEKFKKNGLADSILGSVTNMIKDNIQPLSEIPLCNSEKWRLKQYFTEQNDNLIKKYRPIFTQIYKKNSKMKVKPGNKPFMCLTEFKSIIQRIGVAGTHVLQRDIFLSFNCSMMTQIDQLENQRFIRMTEIQFIEAVARCAYILPASCKVQDIFENTTPFYAKFEWIIHQLKIICSDDIKNMFSDRASIFNKSQDD